MMRGRVHPRNRACEKCQHSKAIHYFLKGPNGGVKRPCGRLNCPCENYVPPKDTAPPPASRPRVRAEVELF
jgi:hypothetical protein